MEENKMQEGRDIRGEIAQFMEVFPQVKPGEVPQAVWQEVRQGKTLALAYALYRMEQAEESLRKAQGRRLSAGSVHSAGNGGVDGTVAAFWDAYEI